MIAVYRRDVLALLGAALRLPGAWRAGRPLEPAERLLVAVFVGTLPPGGLRATAEGRLVWQPLAALRDPSVPFLDDVRALLPRVAAWRPADAGT